MKVLSTVGVLAAGRDVSVHVVLSAAANTLPVDDVLSEQVVLLAGPVSVDGTLSTGETLLAEEPIPAPEAASADEVLLANGAVMPEAAVEVRQSAVTQNVSVTTAVTSLGTANIGASSCFGTAGIPTAAVEVSVGRPWASKRVLATSCSVSLRARCSRVFTGGSARFTTMVDA